MLPGSHHPDLIRRAEPFIPKRVPSVFAESAGLKTDLGSENETEREEVDNTSSGSILGLTSDSEGNHDSSDEESKPADLNESKDEDYITFNWKVSTVYMQYIQFIYFVLIEFPTFGDYGDYYYVFWVVHLSSLSI